MEQEEQGAWKGGPCLCGGLNAKGTWTFFVFLDSCSLHCDFATPPIKRWRPPLSPCIWAGLGPALTGECSGNHVVPFPTLDIKRCCMLLLAPLGTLSLCMNKPGLACWKRKDQIEESPVSPAETMLDHSRTSLPLNLRGHTNKVSRVAYPICSWPQTQREPSEPQSIT